MSVRPPRTLRLPAELTTERPPELTAAVLERILAEYHRQFPVPRYRILESKIGLHLIPDTAHDASGNVGPARNVMETIITVGEADRTASDHFTAICDEIGRQTGLKTVCMAIGAASDPWFEKLFAVPGGKLKWGAKAVSARDALVDLLDHSATSFAYFAQYDRSTLLFGSPRFTIDLRYIRVPPARDANGKVALHRLEYDRRKP
jgi:hypothetical protein